MQTYVDEQLRVIMEESIRNRLKDFVFVASEDECEIRFEFENGSKLISVSVEGEPTACNVAHNVEAFLTYLFENSGLLLEILGCFPETNAEVESYYNFMQKLSDLEL